MSDNSRIEWTEATWNPVTGCTKVSPGCDHCYAETLYNRFHGVGAFDKVTMRPTRLGQPFRWRKPRLIFVNSMSDLFHDDVTDTYICDVFAVMSLAPQHAFQVLTKRHGRMRSLLSDPAFEEAIRTSARVWKYGSGSPDRRMDDRHYQTWPLPNVWLGVSVEDQKWASIRVPSLLDTPAAVRFLSCEPLLGPVCLDPWHTEHVSGSRCSGPPAAGLHWVIVGAESGRGARPMDEQWARDIKDQCVAAAVPFFLKQYAVNGRKVHLPRLDGRVWDQMPSRLGVAV